MGKLLPFVFATAAMTVGTLGAYFDENRCSTRMRITLLGSTTAFPCRACASAGDPIRVLLSGFHLYDPGVRPALSTP